MEYREKMTECQGLIRSMIAKDRFCRVLPEDSKAISIGPDGVA